MIMLDLQKAFETVDHEILCSKLQEMGIESVEWFQTYLNGRKQAISVNNTMSDYMSISCGVRQGSILENCSKWLADNKLYILGKTGCRLFKSRQKSAKVENFNVYSNGHTMKSQNSVNYYGSILDNYLTVTYIDLLLTALLKKVDPMLIFLYRQNHCSDMNLRKMLGNSLIQYLSYYDSSL